MSDVRSSSVDFEAVLRREAALQWGWGLFTSGALGCALSSYWLYWLVTDGGVGVARFWLNALLCAPFCLLSYAGLVQILSGTTCNRLARMWHSLKPWRRVLIALSTVGAILFLASFPLFLAYLTQPAFDSD